MIHLSSLDQCYSKPNDIDLSVILPALTADDDFNRCVYSLRAALSGVVNYEVLCIVPDSGPFKGCLSHDLTIIVERNSGIYSAMNQGIELAVGRYLYFIGQDDILLPSAAVAVKAGVEQSANLILADVFFGKNEVFRNTRSRNSLVWRNWCHQGIFYDRVLFLASVNRYPLQYRTQADHFANIVFSSLKNVNSIKFKSCVAWYSASGLSSRSLDAEFRRSFPGLVLEHFGPFSFAIVVFRRWLLSISRHLRILK